MSELIGQTQKLVIFGFSKEPFLLLILKFYQQNWNDPVFAVYIFGNF